MSFNLTESAKRKILVVAHRGACGGNIPCNTIASYNIALKQGADMIEIDVDMSVDGKLYIFHPGMEKPHLGHNRAIREMVSTDIETLRFNNMDETPTQFGLNTLDEVLEEFKGRCYINVDKFWDHPEPIAKAIQRHGMQEQILVKSTVQPNVLSILKELAPDLCFMPIVSSEHPMHEELLESGIRYVGVEVLFDKETDEVCQPEFLSRMHKDGILVWANAIIYNYLAQLTAGHSDDTALTKDEQEGWGWLADRGFDLIQTDWPLMLSEYLNRTNRLYRTGLKV